VKQRRRKGFVEKQGAMVFIRCEEDVNKRDREEQERNRKGRRTVGSGGKGDPQHAKKLHSKKDSRIMRSSRRPRGKIRVARVGDEGKDRSAADREGGKTSKHRHSNSRGAKLKHQLREKWGTSLKGRRNLRHE